MKKKVISVGSTFNALRALISTKTEALGYGGMSSREFRLAEDKRKAAPPAGRPLNGPTVGEVMEPYAPDPRWRQFRMARPGHTYRAERRAEAKRLRKRLRRPDAP